MKDMVQTQRRPPVAGIRRTKSTKSLITISSSPGVAKQPLSQEISNGEERLVRTSRASRYTTSGKRPFASYYYTSSFPSLYSLFCGDRGMSGQNSANVRPATTANGNTHIQQSEKTQQELNEQESEHNHNQVRFPWRRVTSAEPQQKGTKDLEFAKPETRESANMKVNTENGGLTAKSRTKAEGDIDDVVHTSKTACDKDESSTNIKITPTPNTRPPSSGTRNRSKSSSWASRPHDVTVTPKLKMRHHSSNSYATIPTTPHFTPFKNPAPMPVWNPSERTFTARLPLGERKSIFVDPPGPEVPFLKSKSYADFNRASNNYKAAIANSYSPHIERKGRSKRKPPKTALGVRFGQTEKSKEAKTSNVKSTAVAGDTENRENAVHEDTRNITDLSEVSKRLSLVGNQRHLSNYGDKTKNTSPGLQRRFEAKRELTHRLTSSTHVTPHRRLADSTIDAAVIYKERFRPMPKKTFLTPEQLVMRDSVEKVQRWIRTLPRHFDTIHHVLPPVRQDY